MSQPGVCERCFEERLLHEIMIVRDGQEIEGLPRWVCAECFAWMNASFMDLLASWRQPPSRLRSGTVRQI